jgi:predicted NBD/HSP70 family sugar kinase
LLFWKLGESQVHSAKEKQWLIVYDVGGSHATAALLKESSLLPELIQSTPIDSTQNAEAVFNSLQKLEEEVLSGAGVQQTEIAGVAFAVPGPFDYENGISYLQHKYQALYRRNFRVEFSQRFGLALQDIHFINDAHAFLLGEIHSGGAKASHRALGITLGTGVGSAFAVEGHIVETGEGVPPNGEIYNLPWRGGIVEDTISTRAIQKEYEKLSGKVLSVKEICARVETEEMAAKVMEKFGEDLGCMFNEVTAPFKPDIVVIGGAISQSGKLFFPSTKRTMKDQSCSIVASQLLDRAALIGAGAHWRNRVGVA